MVQVGKDYTKKKTYTHKTASAVEFHFDLADEKRKARSQIEQARDRERRKRNYSTNREEKGVQRDVCIRGFIYMWIEIESNRRDCVNGRSFYLCCWNVFPYLFLPLLRLLRVYLTRGQFDVYLKCTMSDGYAMHIFRHCLISWVSASRNAGERKIKLQKHANAIDNLFV